MMPPIPRDTIFALSSGAPPAAVAIIRISGPAADAALMQLAGKLPFARTASLSALRDRTGNIIDRALVLRFPGPHSATGEDVVELQVHGGRATIAAVLRRLAELDGLRAAEPGEFTRRAFDHGRIDLSQAEGLADLLSAETEAQRRNAMRLADGGLRALVERWRGILLALSAQTEAEIEFAEEEDVVAAEQSEAMAELRREIGVALSVPPVERLLDGVRIVIAGPPNAGKSSLINAITGRSVAIATPIPGTTRDLVEAPVVIGRLPCILIDSAGLRESEDEVERIGVERSRAAIAAADILLWLGTPKEAPIAERLIRVAAKCDIDVPDHGHDVAISVVTGEGLESLNDLIVEAASSLLPHEDELAIGERQRHVLATIKQILSDAQHLDDAVLRAALLGEARHALDRLSGHAGVEDMLDTLFGRFCIGK